MPNGFDLGSGTLSRKDAQLPTERTRLLGFDQFDNGLAKQNKHYPGSANCSQGCVKLVHLFLPSGLLGRLSTSGGSALKNVEYTGSFRATAKQSASILTPQTPTGKTAQPAENVLK